MADQYRQLITNDATGLAREYNRELADHLDNMGIESKTAQSLTPNSGSETASVILPGTTNVDVGAVDSGVTDFIVLPSLSAVPVGHVIRVACNAGGAFEIRTPAASAEEINSEDCDGTKEYLATDGEIIHFHKISNAIGWMAQAWSAIGAVVAAVVPD